MIIFALTAALYAGLLAFLQPEPESLKQSKLSLKENLLAVKGSLLTGLFLILVFWVTSDFEFLKINEAVLTLFGLHSLKYFTILWPVQAVTHLLLHHDLIHLYGNLLGIGLASVYERRVGTAKFLKILGLGALCSLPSILFYSEPVVICGISGGIFGVAAAYFIDFKNLTKKEFLFALVGFTILTVILSAQPRSSEHSELFKDISTDHVGHVLGAIGVIMYLRYLTKCKSNSHLSNGKRGL